jgi:phosphoribosylglycinamide formyltransferase 1
MDLNVHEEVLKAGKTKSGATLHFVDETPDGGPIIFQKEVEIAKGESASSLKEKVQAVEQELIVKAVDLFGKGRIKVAHGKVSVH